MNYLAHAWLARHTPELLTGGMLGDFVKGSLGERYPHAVRAGILLHRAIDGEPVPGTCVLVTLEGTRPLLVEIQALVDSGGPSPRRLSVGQIAGAARRESEPDLV